MADAVNHGSTLRTCVVADDHPAILALVTRVLSQQQFRVFTAPDGRKALELLAAQPSCDLLVTDLAMPDGEGIETIRTVRQRYPTVKILAISGAFGGHMLRAAQMLGADATLGKPFTPDTLVATVRALLEPGTGIAGPEV
jgi:DNA-binding response OmpR family regulator